MPNSRYTQCTCPCVASCLWFAFHVMETIPRNGTKQNGRSKCGGICAQTTGRVHGDCTILLLLPPLKLFCKSIHRFRPIVPFCGKITTFYAGSGFCAVCVHLRGFLFIYSLDSEFCLCSTEDFWQPCCVLAENVVTDRQTDQQRQMDREWQSSITHTAHARREIHTAIMCMFPCSYTFVYV